MADLALFLHLVKRAEALFKRGAGVDAVELVEFDALQLEAAQAHFDALDEVARTAHVLGFGRTLAGDAAFGGDDQTGGIGVRGLRR